MHNLGRLMQYEWKKLFQKKLVWVTILVIFTLQVASNLGFLMETFSMALTDSNGNVQEVSMNGWEILQTEKENAWKLNGRTLNSQLVQEMKDAPTEFAFLDAYAEVSSILRKMGGVETEEQLYELRIEEIYENWKAVIIRNEREDYYLTEPELAYWQKRIDTIETPFVYQYDLGWSVVYNQVLTNSVMTLLLIAVCLSGLFADEHKLKTDQMLLCMKNSKQVYYAKTLTGILFGIGSTAALYVITLGFCFGFYGTEGYHAILQQELVLSPWTLTLGESVLVLIGLSILAAVLESVAAMFLSEYLNNGVGVMAVLVGIMLLTQIFNIPERYRVLSQLWNFLPTNLVTVWSMLDGRLVPIFGMYLTNFQFAGMLYPVLSILLILWNKRRYQCFQVTGR